MIQAGLKNEKGIQMIYDLPKWAYVQALLSNGDRRVAKILLAVHRNKGDWGKALRESSMNPISSSIGQESLTRSSRGISSTMASQKRP